MEALTIRRSQGWNTLRRQTHVWNGQQPKCLQADIVWGQMIRCFHSYLSSNSIWNLSQITYTWILEIHQFCRPKYQLLPLFNKVVWSINHFFQFDPMYGFSMPPSCFSVFPLAETHCKETAALLLFLGHILSSSKAEKQKAALLLQHLLSVSPPPSPTMPTL